MATTSPESPTERKKGWEALLTSTPVVLTVIGTLLAGLANSEMTQAQYRRSLAAQYQSKTSDQWAFFQAKRDRNTTYAVGLIHFPPLAIAGKWTPDRCAFLSTRLAAEQRVVQQRLKSLPEALRAALPNLAADVKTAEAPVTRLAAEMKKPENAAFFDYLGQDRLPLPPEPPATEATPIEKAIQEALADSKANKPEETSAAKLLSFDREIARKAIQDAIDQVEGKSKQFDKLIEPVQTFLRVLERKLLADQLAEAAAVHRLVQEVDVHVATNDVAGDFKAALPDLHLADLALTAAANDLHQGIRGLQEDFEARRYRSEASYNQSIAYHYEVMVRFQGAISERHRLRSRQFFYGMLCAQAGVVIGSMALAARYKSVLWSLAGLAGFAALGFSLYVYLWV